MKIFGATIMKAKISLLVLMILLLGSIIWAGFPLVNADYSSLIEIVPIERGYIRGDGSIEPSTLPIERSGNVYSLKDNVVNYTIAIQKSNIILDGKGFTLALPQSVAKRALDRYGDALIQIQDSNDIIVKNTQFKNYFTGISINNSYRITILGNNLTNGRLSVELRSCSDSDIVGNNLKENSNTGLFAMDSTYLNIAYNNISRNENGGGDFVRLTYSNISRNNIIDNSMGDGSGSGIFALAVDSNRFFENNLINNPTAIVFSGDYNSSVNNFVYRNYFHDNDRDILNVGGDANSGINESPLQSPLSIEIELELYIPSSQNATNSNPNGGKGYSPETIIISTAFAIALSVLVACLWYYRRRFPRK